LEALHIFRDMISEGMYCHPQRVPFWKSLGVELLVIWGMGSRFIHCLSVKYKLDRNSYASCSFSDMYPWYSKLESASKVFSRIEVPDLVGRNSLMNA
jgi:hypothetical protein